MQKYMPCTEEEIGKSHKQLENGEWSGRSTVRVRYKSFFSLIRLEIASQIILQCLVSFNF